MFRLITTIFFLTLSFSYGENDPYELKIDHIAFVESEEGIYTHIFTNNSLEFICFPECYDEKISHTFSPDSTIVVMPLFQVMEFHLLGVMCQNAPSLLLGKLAKKSLDLLPKVQDISIEVGWYKETHTIVLDEGVSWTIDESLDWKVGDRILISRNWTPPNDYLLINIDHSGSGTNVCTTTKKKSKD